MEQSDIDKLLALRSAWDKFKALKEKSKPDFDDFYKVFWSYGMAGHHDLVEFNNAMLLQFIRENYTIHGKCDSCKGYKDTPPCIAIYGANSCSTSKEIRERGIDKELMYNIIFKTLRLNVRMPEKCPINVSKDIHTSGLGVDKPTTVTISGDTVRLVCPPGHGYYHDYVIPVEKAPFDLYWTP
jgi:hypothetical protein